MAAALDTMAAGLRSVWTIMAETRKIENQVKQRKVNKYRQRERDLSGGGGGGRSRRQWAS